jgi:hypothetical protein
MRGRGRGGRAAAVVTEKIFMRFADFVDGLGSVRYDFGLHAEE